MQDESLPLDKTVAVYENLKPRKCGVFEFSQRGSDTNCLVPVEYSNCLVPVEYFIT